MRAIRWGLVLLLAAGIQTAGAAESDWTKDGEFGHWRVSCKVDSMNDKRSCVISSSTTGLSVVTGENRLFVMVGTRQVYKTAVMIRIDDQSPRSTEQPGWIGRPAEQLTNDLRTAQRIRVRWNQVLAGTQDAEIPTEGYAAALDRALELSGMAPKAAQPSL